MFDINNFENMSICKYNKRLEKIHKVSWIFTLKTCTLVRKYINKE